MELRIETKLVQKLVMTPQLQQAIKLLQLSRLELQQYLSQHLTENVLLEDVTNEMQEEESPQESENETRKELENEELSAADEGGTKEEQPDIEAFSAEDLGDVYNDWRPGPTEPVSPSDDDLPSYEQTLTKPISLEEHIEWQLRLSSLEGTDRVIGTLIVGNLDEDGYLRVPVEEIAEDAHVPLEAVENVLRHVQTFDPPGVGARDLRECLLIQLKHLECDPIGMGNEDRAYTNGDLVKAVVTDHLPDLQKKRYANIAKALNVSLDGVYEAVKVIEGLEPKPGRPYFSDSNTIIIPDVYVVKHEGEWVIRLNEDGLPKVRISPYYRRMMSNQTEDPDSKAYLEDKLRGAQWIIRSIDQRNKTIVKVVTSLVKFQEEFLEKGIQYLRPLVLKQVAEDVEMHESTISRVTTNKYMHCPQGIFELKFFFNAGIQRADNRGEDISSKTVMDMIREMVAQEDVSHPLKDQEIVSRLRGKDILIARRTVAKYRAELNISPASQRKRIP